MLEKMVLDIRENPPSETDVLKAKLMENVLVNLVIQEILLYNSNQFTFKEYKKVHKKKK